MRRVTIGLLGCGTVGAGFVALLGRERERIRAQKQVDLQIIRVLVRDTTRRREGVPHTMLTTAATDAIDGADIVVELIGGVHSAGAYVRRALRNGKHVVTANKALLAVSGRDLKALADRAHAHLAFEASVCAGIPIVRAIEHGLAGDSIQSVSGILNATTNYILTRMEERGTSYGDALAEAQRNGFAEADPGLDVSGEDAAQKLRILAGFAFGIDDERAVRRRIHGIEDVTQTEIEQARSRRAVIRHVATARRARARIELSVERRELPESHPLASVRHENNGVIVRGAAVGEMLFVGKGAGALPTAAAVLADVVDVATRPAPHTI
jgi:homoserine dehydrogenase